MKKIGILLEKDFNEEEFLYPYHRLREKYDVVVIGTEGQKSYLSKYHFPYTSDVASSEVDPSTLDGLIIPGGFSPDYMRRHPATIDLVKALDLEKKPIGAICHAGWMIASCCDIANVKVTSYPSIKDDLIHAGGLWVDEEVVVSGHLVTSRTPKDLPAFMKAFIALL